MDGDFLAADGENLMGGSTGGKTMRRGLAGRTISVAGKPSRARDRAAHRPPSEKNRDTQWSTRAEISAVEEGF
jgi:hypothetical protein